jgi:N-acetylmuramoyl-L-alanine amidase
VDRRSKFAFCLLVCSAVLTLTARTVRAQEQAPAGQPRPAPNRSIVLLDPGHGGTDPGADLGNKVAEKDVTFALATKLRGALTAQGFAVVLTRDTGSTEALTAEQRAVTANRSHPMACISLHATRSGSGVHVYTSALPVVSEPPEPELLLTRWETAQESFVAQSLQFAAAVKTSLGTAGLSATTSTATVPPLDSMTCPAVAIEFAPLNTLESADKGIDDARYQDSAVRGMVAALVKWRTDTTPPPAPAKGTP